MKILLEFPKSSPYALGSVKGGVERAVDQIRETLEEFHDLVIFASADSDHLPFPMIRSSLASKDSFPKNKNFPHKVWTEELSKAAEKFDVVILSSPMNSRTWFDYPELCKKMLVLNHYPFLTQPGRGAMPFYAYAKFLREHGGVCLGVSEASNESSAASWEKRKHEIAQFIGESRSTSFNWDTEIYDGTFDVNFPPSDLTVKDSFVKGKVLAIGRPEAEKKLKLAIKTFAAMKGRGLEFAVYTTTADGSDELVALAEELEVPLHLDAKHDEIMEDLSTAECLFFPSTSETNGICAFEGAFAGCKVIYQCDPPDAFLIAPGSGFKRQMKTVKQAVTAIEEVLDSPFDREAAIEWFAKNYSKEAKKNLLESWANKIAGECAS